MKKTQQMGEKLIKTSVKVAGGFFLAAIALKGYENYLETCNIATLLKTLCGVGTIGAIFVAGYQAAVISLDD